MKSDAILDKIRKKLETIDQSNRTLTKIFLINFKDENGDLIKSVVMDLKELTLQDGTVENPDVEVTVSDEDFFSVGSKQVPFSSIIEEGKVQVKGDQEAFDLMVEKFNLHGKH